MAFHGYDNIPSTKVVEQRGRSRDVHPETSYLMTLHQLQLHKDHSRQSSNNKKKLIQALRETMSKYGIYTKQAGTDADRLIVCTALLSADSSDLPVTVVRTDIDLLIKLVVQALPSTNVYLLCQNNPPIMYSCTEIQHAIRDTTNHLMLLHVVTGCDTVSAIYRQSKRRALNCVMKTDVMDNWAHSL